MSFRQIDIDAIEGKRWVNDAIEQVNESELQTILNQKTSDVRSLLAKGNNVEALKKALENPPYFSENEDLKNQSLSNVFDALTTFRTSQLNESIQELTSEEQDVLLKYVYRAMAHPAQYNSSVALNWHEKLVEIGGNASIIRVLTDYRTV